MADGHHPAALVAEDADDAAGGLALAAAGADGADGHHRHPRLEHAGARTDEAEVGARGEDEGRGVHDGLVGHVAVGEDDLIGPEVAHEPRQVGLGMDGDALGITRPRQLRRIAAALDVRDLGGGEGHHLGAGVVAEDRVEVVEVAARGSHDDDPGDQ